LFTHVFVTANISSAEVDVWRDDWVEHITAGPRALCCRCFALRRAKVCRVHWTKDAGQAAVACDWPRSGTVLSPGAEGKSSDFANGFLLVLNIWGVVLSKEVRGVSKCGRTPGTKTMPKCQEYY